MSCNSSARPGAGDHLGAGATVEPADPAARPVRRSFTAAYRARVVAEYEAAPHGSKAAVTMIAAALDAGVLASWVAGDEVYGADPDLRKLLSSVGSAMSWRSPATAACAPATPAPRRLLGSPIN